MDIERRDFDIEELEVRDTAGGQTIRGLALPFNRNSADLGGFIERIDPGAITLDGTDIVMLWQHDSADPITRQSSGLELEVRKSGLWFEAQATDFSERQLDLLQRGVVKNMSFGFVTIEDEWQQESKPVVRTLKEIELREISPVTWPAYKQTSVAVRSAHEAGIDLPEVVPEVVPEAPQAGDESVRRDRLRLGTVDL
mgnify:FL=1